MTNSDYYQSHTYNTLEIAISMEDMEDNKNKGKFFIPILTPFLDGETPYDKKDLPYDEYNFTSDTPRSSMPPCTTSNYIELYLPEIITECKKGDKFVIAFIGGDINKPYIIGRYRQ